MSELIAKFLLVAGAVAISAGIGLLLAFPIKWCWNYTMPYLFALKEISWGQAWCLNFVAGSLIKTTQTQTKRQ